MILKSTVPQIIFQAAGLLPSSDLRGDCRLCGAHDTTGFEFAKWVKKTFTNWSDLHPGLIICDACEFCCREANEYLTAWVGAEKPQKMRNYSHIVDASGIWHPLTKSHKRQIYEFLVGENPQAVVIADSGQKHLCFRARPGWWHFEGLNMEPNPVELIEITNAARALYELGFTKNEIMTGNYSMRSLSRAGDYKALLEFERSLSGRRGSGYFTLALFLLTTNKKEEATDDH